MGGGSALGTDPAATLADRAQRTEQVAEGLDQENQIESNTEAQQGLDEAGIVMSEGADDAAIIPAATQRVNEDVTLSTRTVAQAESTRSYFLAQTLESTRTVPIVSANLPLDTGTVDIVESEGDDQSATEEGGEDSDESDPVAAPIAAESIVVGSFVYRGITYAVEPGGESVAVVAADYSKLPEEFIEAQTIVLPSMATADGLSYYSVTRIADYAFTGLSSQHVISSEGDEVPAVEKSALIEQNEGEALASSREDAETSDDETVGITTITIPASVTEIGDDAFSGFDTLQYVIVSEDNPIYGMYDGCLYDADFTSLLLIPEGRLGAVWVAPSAVTIDPLAFSHCAVDTVIADPDSAAFQLLSENDFRNKETDSILLESSEKNNLQPLDAHYSSEVEFPEIVSAVTVSATGAQEGANALEIAQIGKNPVLFYRAKSTDPSLSPLKNYIEERNTENADISTPIWKVAIPSAGHYVRLCSADANATLADRNVTIYYCVTNSSDLPHGHATHYSYPMTSSQFLSFSTAGWMMSGVYNRSWKYSSGAAHMNSQGYAGNNSPGSACFGLDGYETGVIKAIMHDGTKLSDNWVTYPSSVITVYYYYSATWDLSGTGGCFLDDSGHVTTQSKVENKNLEPDDDTGKYTLTTIPVIKAPYGKVLDYWQGNDYEKTRVYPNDTSVVLNDITTFTPVWKDAFKVTLSSNYEGGSDDFFYANVKDATTPDLVGCPEHVSQPVRDGYCFDGYYALENGEKLYWYKGETIHDGEICVPRHNGGENIPDVLTDDLTLYADWVRDITLDTQGAKSTANDQKVHVTWNSSMPTQAITGTGACAPENGPANHGTTSIVLPEKDGYEFCGYWSTEYDESDASKQYYEVKDGSVAPVEGKTWDIDADRLYAHWKYKIVLNDNAYDCEGHKVDASIDWGSFASASGAGFSVVTEGEGAPYIEVVLGAPIPLPKATRAGYGETRAWGLTSGSNGKAGWVVKETSDFWTAGSDGTKASLADASYTKNGAATENYSVTPGVDDHTLVLYASWLWDDATPDSDKVVPGGGRNAYKVNLVAAYDGYAPDNSYATVKDVVFDEPFLEAGESLVAPHIAGYRFMGYFTDKNGAGEAYTEATDNSNKGQVGCLRVNGSPKPFTVAGLENGDTVDLYAAYERLEYTVRFNTDAIQPADATKVSSVVSDLRNTPFSASELASYQGRLEANKHQATDLSEGFAASSLKLHYGDALAGEHALPTPALENGRTATFWCTGYTFCGWYSFPIEEDGTLNVVYTENGMVDLKASGAVRFKAGSYGSSHPVSKELASFDVEIADVENPTMTLYAVWERNAYAITWDETSSLSTSSVTAPTQLAYQIALYGSKVERANPVFRDHVFAGTWHTSAACTGAAVVLDPYRPSASSSSSPIYFAKWDGTEEHAVYFYPGAHGSFEGAAYLEAPYLYADATSVSFGHYSQALSRDAGYAFAGWREAANAEDAAAGLVKDQSSTPINSLSGVAGFSTRHDDIHLVAQYSARTYVMLLDANGARSSIPPRSSSRRPMRDPSCSRERLR